MAGRPVPRPEPEALEEAAEAQRIDARSEHPEDGRQERQRIEHRAEDDERPADADRVEGGRLHEQEAGQADGDREPGERHGLAARRDGLLDRLADGPPAGELLAEAAHDEERVVDRQGEAEHRRDVQDVDAHLDPLGDEVDEPEGSGDRQAGDDQRHPGRDHRREHRDEDEQRQRRGDDLGALEVLLRFRRLVAADRPIPGERRGVAGRRCDLRLERLHRVDRLLVRQVELHDGVRRMPVRADEPAIAGLGEADDPDDT